jgi:hypothetical protein
VATHRRRASLPPEENPDFPTEVRQQTADKRREATTTPQNLGHYIRMDSSTVQLLTASLGVGGTLSASIFAQVFMRRGERDRRRADDQARWLTERLRITSQIISRSVALERQLCDAACFLDNKKRAKRIPGYKSLHLVPKEGVPGVIDAEVLEIVVDSLHSAGDEFNDLELLEAELKIIGGAAEAEAASELLMALLDLMGEVEVFARADDAFSAARECATSREALVRAVRNSLRVDDRAPQSIRATLKREIRREQQELEPSDDSS